LYSGTAIPCTGSVSENSKKVNEVSGKVCRGGEGMTKAIKSKEKKRNNIVILINAENEEELEAIKKEFLLATRKAARKRELGFYITPVETASFETIQNFGDFSLKISARNRG